MATAAKTGHALRNDYNESHQLGMCLLRSRKRVAASGNPTDEEVMMDILDWVTAALTVVAVIASLLFPVIPYRDRD